MPTITTPDGTQIFYKDWGHGRPIVFCHGWPLSADAWDSQMMFLAQRGYRVIAHDRRGHGRSDQPWQGNDMDTYADDLAALIESLDLQGAILIGHSTGGGEVARYIGRHGSKRVAKVVLIGAVPPIMVKSDTHPDGIPVTVFDGLRAGVINDRSLCFKEVAVPFYGFNRPNAKVSQGAIDSFWNQGMQGSIKGLYDCIKQFSETDFTTDLRSINVPTLVLHGDDDQIVPFEISGKLSATLIPNATLEIVKGGPHGMCTVNADEVNEKLLKFISA